MRYYLDADLDPDIAVAARALGIDIVSVYECGASALADEAQLARAASERRCIVTFNRDDFQVVTRMAYDKNAPHCGVLIVIPQWRYSRYGVIAKALAAHSARFPEDTLPAYTIAFLTHPDPA
jgi:predicted nuclease of predicted toxin-antitoxin system